MYSGARTCIDGIWGHWGVPWGCRGCRGPFRGVRGNWGCRGYQGCIEGLAETVATLEPKGVQGVSGALGFLGV